MPKSQVFLILSNQYRIRGILKFQNTQDNSPKVKWINMHLLQDFGLQAQVNWCNIKCRKSLATARTIGIEIISRTSPNFHFRSTSGPRNIKTFWTSLWKQLKSLIWCQNLMRKNNLGRSTSSQKYHLLFRLRSCIICLKSNCRLRITSQINMSWIRIFGNLKYELWAISRFLWAAAGRPRMFANRWILTPLSAAEAKTSSSRHFRQKVQ